ncbi:hypothetical protein CKAN_00421700 [Cinnamomum micranthum f. kanehirae]|uniref:Pentatricopeptide repeat-containing protein n=1 Tax=Cinnamomum micranthum f. kanehirae TaxID=337451 RepID=A0A443NBE1_9MAGN|nr:hypothetical protein CKAN_00421700 [Cinnamomum micranthum f. kanehirae]
MAAPIKLLVDGAINSAEMVENGYGPDGNATGSCKPNVVVYILHSIIIDSLCKDGSLKEALNLFLEMNDNKISPDAITHCSLIHGLCNSGKWKEATELFTDMVKRDVFLDVITFSTFLWMLFAKEAYGLLEVMIEIVICGMRMVDI